MAILVYAVLGLAITWALYAGYMLVATRAAEGRPADPLYALFPGLRDIDGRALIYCFSPHCAPCRPMSHEVASLLAANLPVYRLDVTAHPDISRALGIRATPTLVVVHRGSIARMLLGVKTAAQMRALLEPDSHPGR